MMARNLLLIAVGLNSACFCIAGQPVKAISFQYPMPPQRRLLYYGTALKTRKFAINLNGRSFLDTGFFFDVRRNTQSRVSRTGFAVNKSLFAILLIGLLPIIETLPGYPKITASIGNVLSFLCMLEN